MPVYQMTLNTGEPLRTYKFSDLSQSQKKIVKYLARKSDYTTHGDMYGACMMICHVFKLSQRCPIQMHLTRCKWRIGSRTNGGIICWPHLDLCGTSLISIESKVNWAITHLLGATRYHIRNNRQFRLNWFISTIRY